MKTSAIGDVLQAFPIIDELRAHVPLAQIDWVVERPSASLLEQHPQLHRVLIIETKKWRRALFRYRKEVFDFLSTLRHIQYDLLFDLQGNAKSGLITLLAKAHRKVGYDWQSAPEKINTFATHRRVFVPKHLDMRSHYLYLIRSLFEKDSPLKESICDETYTKLEARSGEKIQPTLMVCFGSNWKNKQLSDTQLFSLLHLIANYCKPRFLFIYGNPDEEKKARLLEATFENSSSIGGLSLLQWQHLMTQVQLIFTMDSAALHLAATTTTPTFSLFGPSSIKAYKPPGDRHLAISGSCPYGIQFDKRCPRLRNCETGACLRTLDPHEIFHAMQQMLDRFLSF